MPPSAAAPPVNPRKRQLARILDRIGVSDLLLRAQARRGRPYVRCVNYHSVPPEQGVSFERQLRWFRRHFVPVGYQDLLDFQEGHWPHPLPGIVLCFDDGCRSHAEVVAPLLERHGFVGWFFVPSRFPDTPVDEQAKFVREHSVSACSPDRDPRLALSWDQLRCLDRRHVVGSHTLDHVRLAAAIGEPELRRQIFGGKALLEEQLDHAVHAFAWVGGEEWSYSAPAARLVAEAGFRVAFGTNNLAFRPGQDLLRIERTNVEACYEAPVLRFQLAGLLDLAYAPKRRRLRRALAFPESDATG